MTDVAAKGTELGAEGGTLRSCLCESFARGTERAALASARWLGRADETAAHHHMHDPIRVEVGRLVRMYVVNLTEFDLINSLHLHGMFFDVYRTGTSLQTAESTDTVMLCQGERAILETKFRYPGRFMFHAHQSEFAELGWMGLFEATGARRDT